MTLTVEDLRVGDDVWCLARVGTPYQVTAVDDGGASVTITPHPAAGRGARPIELPADALWLLATEHWDQIWYWPDRVGESMEVVVDRFRGANPPGSVVTGHFYDAGLVGTAGGFITPTPERAMTFEVVDPAPGLAQIPVRPVVAVDGVQVAAGPAVPLRIGMTSYRWSLAFGEFVLNWQDFLRPD